jgi:predicted DNA-binding protein with PD1-like motif
VEKSRKGDLLVIRFSDGDDLLKELEAVLREEGISSGIVIGGVGMVKNAGLSFYRGRGQYETVPIDGEAELCSLNGNISTLDDQIVVHLHAVVGLKGGNALGGHVSSAKVNMTAEIAVLATQQKLKRVLDPETGLRKLFFE